MLFNNWSGGGVHLCSSILNFRKKLGNKARAQKEKLKGTNMSAFILSFFGVVPFVDKLKVCFKIDPTKFI